MMRTTWIVIALLLHCSILGAQNASFIGTQQFQFDKELETSFSDQNAFHFNIKELKEHLSENHGGEFNLYLSEQYNWNFELYSQKIYSDEANIRILSENGETTIPAPQNIAYYGYLNKDYSTFVFLVIHADYMSATLQTSKGSFIIENADKYLDSKQDNVITVYKNGSQKHKSVGKCGQDLYSEFKIEKSEKQKSKNEKSVGACYKVKLGVASDYLMYQDKFTVAGVLNHVVTVMGNVASNYEYLSNGTNFDDGVEFEIVEQVVSTCQKCDPWTNSTDAGDVLNDFGSWATNGGFSVDIDMGQFWTDRDFDGNTVGLAQNSADLICNNSAFHVLQNFTNDAQLLRVATAHEIAHNFNADHDDATTNIMNSSVTNTNVWGTTAQSVVSQELVDQGATQSCIVTCGAASCPTLSSVTVSNITSTSFNLSYTPTSEGTYRIRVFDEKDGSEIHNQSTTNNSLTLSPTGYDVCEVYKVVVENDCGSSYSAPVSVIFESPTSQGCAGFSADKQMGWSTLDVNFTDESTNATSWLWDFGDGNTSTLQNPSHTYNEGGYYSVSLTINGNAHTKTANDFIVLLPEVTVPYFITDGGNMEDNDFGAVSLTSGSDALWERGSPGSNYFQNSGNAWVTDLDGDMTNTDNESVLYSPKFDFSVSGQYTLSFDLGMEFTFCHAPFAVQVQYSTNDGQVWNRLGMDSDNQWYNRGPSSGCSIANSLFPQGHGWTFNNANGINYSFDVSDLSGNPSVIFRFVFKIESGMIGMAYANDGAMLDNFEISSSLPVELLDFDAEKQPEGVVLSWTTSNEINNDFFEIQRSVDGIEYERLGDVKAKGFSSTINEYGFVDYHPFIGNNYYRLVQFDTDGTSRVLDPINIKITGSSEFSIFPNPVHDDVFKVSYASDINARIPLELYHSSGVKLKEWKLDIEKGLNESEVDVSSLNSGMYFLKMGNQIQRLLIVK